LIILGMPRTGSTKLQRLLCADPHVHSLRFWQMMNPAPFPGTQSYAEDPRIQVGQQILDALVQISPGYLQSHPTKVDDADEEAFLQLYNFTCRLFALTLPDRSFLDLAIRSVAAGYLRLHEATPPIPAMAGRRQT
jgi:hypothetical protein